MSDSESDSSEASSPYSSDGEVITSFGKHLENPDNSVSDSSVKGNLFPNHGLSDEDDGEIRKFLSSGTKGNGTTIYPSAIRNYLQNTHKEISSRVQERPESVAIVSGNFMSILTSTQSSPPDGVLFDLLLLCPTRPVIILTFTSGSQTESISTEYNNKLNRRLVQHVRATVKSFSAVYGVVDETSWQTTGTFKARVEKLTEHVRVMCIPQSLTMLKQKCVDVASRVLHIIYRFPIQASDNDCLDVQEIKEKLLKCPVCWDYFDQATKCPRYLSCDHVFCTNCLCQVLEEHRIKCPLCRRTQGVKESAQDLPISYIKSRLVELVRLKAEEVLCMMCADNHNVFSRCLDCKMYLCRNCDAVHRALLTTRLHVFAFLKGIQPAATIVSTLERDQMASNCTQADIENKPRDESRVLHLQNTVLDSPNGSPKEIAVDVFKGSQKGKPQRLPLGLSRFQVKYLTDQSVAMSSLRQKLKKRDYHCEFDLEAGMVDIYSPTGKTEEEALQIIRKSIMEINFPADEVSKVGDTAEYLPSQSPNCPGALLVKEGDTVKLVAMDLLETGVTASKQSFDERKENVLKMEKNKSNYLYTYKLAELRGRLKQISDDVKLEHDRCGIKLICSAYDVHIATEILQSEIDRIYVLPIFLPPELPIGSLMRDVNEIEDKYQCIISREMDDEGAPQDAEPQCVVPVTNSSVCEKEARVHVVMNAIETQQADVIVNTTNSMLDLKRGRGVSRCIAQAAGESIQRELSKQYPRGIRDGDLAVSLSGNITSCKTIYHGFLPLFPKEAKTSNDNNLKDICYKSLISMVFNSLIRASASGYGTIAFPALGTGTLQYPAQHVVQLMYRAIKLYNEDKRARNINNIIIVIHPDTKLEVKQIFLAHTQTDKLNTFQVASVIAIHEENRKGVTRKCEFRMTFGETLLQVLNCDLSQAAGASEAIILLWSPSEIQNPNTKASLKSLDPHMVSWKCCLSYVSDLEETMCIVDTTTLHQRPLIHVMCSDTGEMSILAALSTGLEEASKANCNTVTIPVTAQDILGKKPHMSARLVRNVLKNGAPRLFVVTLAIQEEAVFLNYAIAMEHGGREFVKPADTDKSMLAVDLWAHTHSERASRQTGPLKHMQTMTHSHAKLTITSDSKSNNEKAKEELFQRLNDNIVQQRHQ